MFKRRCSVLLCGLALVSVAAKAEMSPMADAEKPLSRDRQECKVARSAGLLDRYYEPANREQAEIRQQCGDRGAFTRFCVVNLDGDSAGTGFTGIILDGTLQYGSTYSSGTTDDAMRDDLASQIAANPFFSVTSVGDTTLVVKPVDLFGIGCGPVLEDSNAKIGTGEYDWSSIIVVESDPQDTHPFGDIENGWDPTSQISDFTITTWWATATYSSGIDDDHAICAGIYTWGPGFWEGVGYTALVQEPVDPTLSCSTTDPDMRLACMLLNS